MHDLSKDAKFYRRNPLQNHLHISKDHSRQANYVMVPQFSFFFYLFYWLWEEDVSWSCEELAVSYSFVIRMRDFHNISWQYISFCVSVWLNFLSRISFDQWIFSLNSDIYLKVSFFVPVGDLIYRDILFYFLTSLDVFILVHQEGDLTELSMIISLYINKLTHIL